MGRCAERRERRPEEWTEGWPPPPPAASFALGVCDCEGVPCIAICCGWLWWWWCCWRGWGASLADTGDPSAEHSMAESWALPAEAAGATAAAAAATAAAVKEGAEAAERGRGSPPSKFMPRRVHAISCSATGGPRRGR